MKCFIHIFLPSARFAAQAAQVPSAALFSHQAEPSALRAAGKGFPFPDQRPASFHQIISQLFRQDFNVSFRSLSCEPELQPPAAVFHIYTFLRLQPHPFQLHMDFSLFADVVEPPAHAVSSMENPALFLPAQPGPVCRHAKKRILRQNHRCAADASAKAQIYLTGVVPGPAQTGLFQPGAVSVKRLKASAGTTVIFFPRD